jgi:protease I
MRIACLVTQMVEDSELSDPMKALKDAGHEVTLISPRKELIVGKKGQVKVNADAAIDAVKPEEFDAIFVPGGFSPDQLRADKRFVDFVRAFDRAHKPIFALCHGPQLLLTAGVLDGHKVTAWQTIQDDLRRAGVQVVDQEVVVDGNLVTSRKPDDIPAFNKAILAVLEKGPVAGVPGQPTKGAETPRSVH